MKWFHSFLSRLTLGKQIFVCALLALAFPVIMFFLFFGGIMLIGSQTFDMEYLHSADQISRIEILYVGECNNDNPAEVENITVCIVVEKAKWDKFLSDLDDVVCRPTGFDSTPRIYGGAIRITYQNGDYEILADYGILQSKNGEKDLLMRRLDGEALSKLLTAYGYQEPTAAPSEGS